MTCEDCIHYEVCKRIDNKMEVKNMSLNETIQEMCRDFKDKFKYIELTCKVGDEVYVIKNNKIHTKDVVYYHKIHSRIAEQNEEYWHCVDKDRISINVITFYPENFGKTVFLTKSEAEQKLKELKENG